MRDIAVTTFILMWLPLVFKHPWIGAVLYGWVSVMNPHKLTFGFAYNLPFAQIIALTTIVGLVTSRDDKRFPNGAPIVLAIFFFCWTSFTTITAIEFDDSLTMWVQFAKNFLMFVVTMAVLKTRRHVDYLIWAMVIAVGYFSFKGGIFTVATGGVYRVWGPDGGKIQENNALAVATIMVIPLMRYLQLHTENRWLSWKNKWVRRGLTILMVVSVVSALGSQSRGALLAISAMGAIFWWKSKHKILIGLGMAIIGTAGVYVMSERWEKRMATIKTYDQDESAISRLFAWETMYNIAKDRPAVGAGFEVATTKIYQRYAPDPTIPWVVVAHSIYFEVLGQHGFIGIFLFLMLWFTTWRTASRIMSISRSDPEKLWARDFAAMCQASLVAYVIGGAFLNLAYFELPYYIMIALVAVRRVVDSNAIALSQNGTFHTPPARRMGELVRSSTA